MSEILRRVAAQYGTTPSAIVDIERHHVSQKQNVSAARQQIIRELAAHPKRFSTPTIGRWLNVHYTSVLYHLKGWKPTEPQPSTPPYDPDAPDESGIWNV